MSSHELTETEQAVAVIWRDVLGVDDLAANDNFFALGGRSLTAMKVIARVRGQLGAAVKLADLFRAPELGSFAKITDSKMEGKLAEEGTSQ